MGKSARSKAAGNSADDARGKAADPATASTPECEEQRKGFKVNYVSPPDVHQVGGAQAAGRTSECESTGGGENAPAGRICTGGGGGGSGLIGGRNSLGGIKYPPSPPPADAATPLLSRNDLREEIDRALAVREARTAQSVGYTATATTTAEKKPAGDDQPSPEARSLADGTGGFLSAADLASKYNLPAEALRKRLERWRAKNFSGWNEVRDAAVNETRYLFDEAVVMPLIAKAKVQKNRA